MNRINRLADLFILAAEKDLFKTKRILKDQYRIAAKFVQSHPDYILIHGTIKGVGVDENRRIQYAWCERGGSVFDPIIGSTVSKWLFYQERNARPEKVYSAKELSSTLKKKKFYGRW